MSKVHTIKFNDFLNGDYKMKPVPKKSFNAYSLVGIPFNVGSFIDPTIITIGGIVLLVVVAERLLVHFGLMNVLTKVEGVMNLAFPIAVICFILYGITHL